MKYTLPILALALLPLSAHAVTLAFNNDGIGTTLDDPANSLPIVIPIVGSPGLTLTVTAVTGPNAVLNATGTILGINSDVPGDSSTNIDPGESFTFQFNQAITITEIDFFSLGSGDSISFAGTTFTTSDANIVDEATTNISIGANQDIVVAGVTGSASLQTITFDIVLVPEPSSSALIAIAIGALGFRRCRT